jgi:DNA-binding response OmpR family regulator
VSRILLIDPDRLTRQLLQRFLERCGCEVMASPGIPPCEGSLPSLVLILAGRPWQAGVALCAEIKRRADLRSVPVVLVMDLVTPALVREAQLAGAAEVLPRLIRPDELLVVVRRQLEQPAGGVISAIAEPPAVGLIERP